MDREKLLHYAAGYFDGEGCITFMRIKRSRPYLRIALVSHDLDSLRVFTELFGDEVQYVNHGKKIGMVYRWDKNGPYAQEVLSELYPYLRSAKKKQAMDALKVPYQKRRTKPRTGLNGEIL
jgi:hypothetical protein